jgi:hypothetical protein
LTGLLRRVSGPALQLLILSGFVGCRAAVPYRDFSMPTEARGAIPHADFLLEKSVQFLRPFVKSPETAKGLIDIFVHSVN